MASDTILKYLIDTNRPYSCVDVTVNLRGAYTKTVVQKTLDALSEAGKIKCKLYGKQKIYAAIQTDKTNEDDDGVDYDNLMKNLTEDLVDKSNALKTAEINLKNLTSAPTTALAKSQIDETKTIIDNLEQKLDDLKNSTEIISVEEKNAILNEHGKLYKAYRKRKGICSDMIEAIMEGYPKSKKSLLEDLCVETDEMVNFKLMSDM